MIAVLQRVRHASVAVDTTRVATIGQGLLVFVGIAKGDSDQDEAVLVEKILHLRIFSDKAGKMNYSLQDIQGELLLVSQFTLLANTRKGRRPSFESAALPDEARARYEHMLTTFKQKNISVQGGIFGADMLITLENDGPVTILLDSRESVNRSLKKPSTTTDKGKTPQKDLAWESQ